MELTVLGSSSMIPTKDRNHPAFFLPFKKWGFLFDCGEGTQRQIKKAEIKPTKITHIFISHWHGDHVLGLPGLFSTLSQSDYSGKIQIYGPLGIKKQLQLVEKAFPSKLNIEIEVHEVEKGIIIDEDEFKIEALSLKHTIPCLAYKFVEKDRLRIDLKKAKKLGLSEGPSLGMLQKGKNVLKDGKKITPKDVTYTVKGASFCYITDTVYFKGLVNFAKNSTLLLCESTFLSNLEDQAKKYGHLTTHQAGSIAKEGNAQKLYLTHLSGRHAYIKEVVLDVQKVFKKADVVKDLEKISF